ncbi:hypothetical protein CcI49_20225 [Frankia sp. CcI49]|uniref:VOC family protein n=1 Tax=unclassified Frankia TaxID=2632575 RepID=UPI0006CA25C2|nr:MULTISPECIES: VOC family protein [unclassified Frankia]KPM54363.1 hypothetical protein ACG83_20730 [Frankia sp. R43]ONH58755.1 hypothetical protein CcI49_20225 [Frankia sp. CcI49]
MGAAGAQVVRRMFHPTFAVVDLEAARAWYRAVFSRPDVRWADRYDISMLDVDYPKDYSFFMVVGDVVLDALCPSMHAQGRLSGQDRYDLADQRPIGLGWYVDDAVAAAAHLAGHGIRTHDQLGRRVEGGHVPVSAMAPDILLFFSEPADTGLRYEFFQLADRYVEYYSRKGDPRLRPDWRLPGAPPPDDPMTIIRGSHHTVLTRRPERALRLYAEALGGTVLGTAPNPDLGTDSTYLMLAGSVFELGVPRPGSPYAGLVTDAADHYLGITFLVADTGAAAAHLAAVGTAAHRDGAGAVVVAPADGFGVQWRFARELPYLAPLGSEVMA